MIIRPAHSTDAGSVGAILSEFVDTTEWMPRIHTRAEDLHHAGTMIDRGWVHVAQTDRVVGFVARHDHDILALYVTAQARGAGIGAALLTTAKDKAKQGQSPLRLWTFQANTGAQQFYLREGFAEVQRTDGAGNDEGLPDIQYQWPAPTL
ncbi:MAG: GNAT family N-acetyltransferase [Primorskyibacter sp.]